MGKLTITSAYQEQFGSLLVRQVRDLVMIEEELWINHRESNEFDWMRSPSETISVKAAGTLWYFCHAIDMDELHFFNYDKSHVPITFWDGLAGNLGTPYINFYARERFPDFYKQYYPSDCEDWVQPDSEYDWDVGGPLTEAECQKLGTGNFCGKLRECGCSLSTIFGFFIKFTSEL